MADAIHASEVQHVTQDPDNVLIDVRERDELEETGFVPGAQHYPMSNFDSALPTLDKDKKYYVMCRSGQRSAQVQNYLMDNGYEAVNVEGGIMAYDGPVNHL
ncbi:rhodanese-like domain-containing protein [Salinicoccus sp. ID82-1]|uniref:Rhodanese-like domain-containing protein n=1 Tax=Salinicoccus cyprini TaxID=2493691 RepID=A0A558AY26_9STAP|nr:MULTISPECIES: rhodanese-like domain-containing protein [Salinicoccus]MCG1008680.1 rhodanese-like domain-containing protein [Salinicoccus sp. ID82-1]TVT29157.1 rhodanese-like domain-containing protein [Salinicoccus cyprini]